MHMIRTRPFNLSRDFDSLLGGMSRGVPFDAADTRPWGASRRRIRDR